MSRRAWKVARVPLAVLLSIGFAAIIAVSGRMRSSGALGQSPAASTPGPSATVGRVVYGLPLELAFREDNVSYAGGDVVAFWLEVPEQSERTVLLLRAGGQMCRSGDDGLPRVEVRIDSALVHTFAVDAPMMDQRVYQSPPLALTPGVHRVALTFSNDYYGGPDCDRNVLVTQLLMTSLGSSRR